MNDIGTSKELTNDIGSDTPQTDPMSDAFGYAPFAKLIASAVIKTPSPQGLVMAIHGPWGIGKSSLLNFIKHYLAEDHKDAQPIVIDFNPWWFDDRSQLADQFLMQFKTALKLENEALRDVGDLISEYSGALGKAVSVSTGIPWIDVPVSGLLKLLKRKPKDVPKLKAEISTALQESDQRFIVVVDDIDRLTPTEIREVFKVVKALADFPNVVYLLSFDRRVVAKALATSMQLDEAGGESYLEKIVQVPFVLPSISKRKLQNKLSESLDHVLKGADIALFDSTYWGNIFMEGIAPLVTKPRDIVRYVNALSLTYPALRDEVNIADFFALEFLRINLPKLYDTIRENPGRFAGYSDRGIQSSDRKEDQAFHQAWAQDVDASIREGVQAMMERIFPKLSNTAWGSEFLAEYRRVRRAAHPDIFPSYFRFALDADQLSRQAVANFIERLSDLDVTEKTLLDAIEIKRTDGSSKARDYLDQLRDYDDEIDAVGATNLLNVLGHIGDKLIVSCEETTDSIFSTHKTWWILWAMLRILARIPAETRNAQLIGSFKNGKALTYLYLTIQSIEASHEKPVDHGSSAALNQIQVETVIALKNIALDRINLYAQTDQLQGIPELPLVLNFWSDWGPTGAARQWAESFVSDISNLLFFISMFLSRTHSVTMGDHVGRIEHTLHLKQMSNFIDLEKAAALLSGIKKQTELEPDHQLVINVFNEQLPLFKEGKDPALVQLGLG
ncbi:KAP family P-loop NTPase fold protein [Andreprevotia chitinilytica]|uniref:KAP family P-loop NTPase fold protein n=1 Tax=Andreprevotia chitinilytica TaxID=396808 RepID=UPI000554B3AA|nr:P-loop NTPase fold protein [Andreprevotia chitinilytica]